MTQISSMKIVSDLQTVLRILPTLSVEDLAHVKQRLAMMNSVSSVDVKLVYPTMFLDVICEVLRARGVEFTYAAQLQKSTQYPAFAKKVPGLLEYFGTVKNVVQKAALVRVSVGLLYDNLIEMNVPVGSRTMMAHIHRIPNILNKHFPGYAQSGLLSMIVRKEENVRNQRRSQKVSRG